MLGLRRGRDKAARPHEDRFGRGVVSEVDLIAPAAVQVEPSHIRVDESYVRTIAIVGYPRYVRPGWLRPLLEFDEPLDIAVHLFPLESGAIVGSLTRKLVQLQSSRLMDARAGRIADAEREVAVEDVERLRDQLQRGEEHVFSVGLYITLRADWPAGLETLTRRVETTLSTLMARSRRCTLQQLPALKSTVPWGRDQLLVTANLDTTSAATLFPFASPSISTGRGVLLGVAKASGAPVILDPFSSRLENASMAVFASSGAGKSYAVKLLLLRSLLLGHDAIVVDPEGEYSPLCRAVNGQEFRLGARSSHVLNPLDLSSRIRSGTSRSDDTEEVDPLADKVASLIGFVRLLIAEPGQALGRAEVAELDRALYETYRRMGITSDPATHDREPPLLGDLHAVLSERDQALANRLERYVSGSMRRVFGGHTNVDLGRSLVSFNLRDIEDELRPIATYLVADHVWTRARAGLVRPCRFVVEEAWSALRSREGMDLMLGLAKRGRKYWLGMTTITQDVEDCLASAEGRAVVANAATVLLMKQSPSSIDALAATFKLTDGERRELLAARRGDGLLCALGTRLPIRIEASPREHALITTNPAELAAQARSGSASEEPTTW